MATNPATDVTRTRAKARDKSAARQAILDAARRVVEKSGVEALNFGTVASEAGFARASVYGYFRSREDLLQCLQADDLDKVARKMGGEDGAEAPLVDAPGPAGLVANPTPLSQGDVASEDEIAAMFAAAMPAEEAPVRAPAPSAPVEQAVPAELNFVADQKAQLDQILSKLTPNDPENSEGSAAAIARFDRRMRVVERTLVEVQDHQARSEKTSNNSVDSIAETLRSLTQRFEESERRQRETFAELRAGAREAGRRLESVEGQKPATPVLVAPLSPDEPAAADVALPTAALEDAARAEDVQAREAVDAPAQPEGATEPVVDAATSETKPAEAKPTATYLEVARRSAQKAATVEPRSEQKRSSWLYSFPRKYLMMACGMMSLVVFVIGVLVVQRMSAISAHAESIAATQRVTVPARKTRMAVLAPLDQLSALASHGNAKAQLIIGLKYLKGSDGVPKNPLAAAQWIARAAKRGEPMAQYWAGYVYQHGLGVSADPDEALRWYEASADQGNTKAMYNLGVAHAQGWTGARDAPEAARWFARAARLGFVDAQFNLAVLYERGEGLPPSLSDAYKWYAVAAANGDIESKKRLDALSTQLNPDDLAAAQRSAMIFKPTPVISEANTVPVLDLKRT